MADSRWHQDIEVAQLIAHLKQDEKRNGDGMFDWSRLTKSEEATVLKELDRCRKDFVYAARNYFWITTKARQDILLTLWPGQELILQKILEIKGKGKAQRLCIIKGRQLGASTVIEALIAWRTMFFANVNALVVSYDRPHTADVLYPIMTTILDKMPWWLKPMVGSRKNDEGISFENPRPELREENPGLKSRVYVKAANTTTAVGMGIRLNAVHVSEFASFEERTAREIIDQDMRHALADGPDTFAILESTAKGANNYSHKLWKTCVERAERADWYPLFLPAFFEANRATTPPPMWRIQLPEYQIREQVIDQWVRCDNPECLQYHMRRINHLEDRDGSVCSSCNIGAVHPYSLTDAQCCFMEDGRLNAARDEEAQKKLKQELCVWTNERISTEYGIVKLSDPEARVATTIETGEKTNYLDNGIRECVRIRTRNGRELVVTPDHLIETEKGLWVQASDSAGKKIRLSRPEFAPDPYTAVWKILPGGVHGFVTIDEKWARLLGYYMGDGCFRGNGIQFGCDIKDQDVVADIASLCEYVMGHPARLRNVGNMTLVDSHDARWRAILESLGCVKESDRRRTADGYTRKHGRLSRKICVPDCIWRSPRAIVKEFLSALFECDGHAYRDSPKTAFFSKHEQFCRDIQLLLLGFGINARIYLAKKIANWNGMTYMGQDLRLNALASNLFNKEIGFVGKRKRSGCKREDLRKNVQRHEMLDVVESVNPAGELPVADITVELGHKYGASGIMVHNCVTATQAFQLEGYQIFGAKAQDFADSCVRDPIAIGDFDALGFFHGVNHEKPRWEVGPTGRFKGCYQKDCTVDHEYTDNPLMIWEWPIPGEYYCLGADVAEGGGGKAAYSAAVMIKYSMVSQPNIQVATWRSNTTDPLTYAGKLNWLGRYYNDSVVAVEMNKYDSCLTTLRINLNYPNMYRWKHMDSVNVQSNKIGWETNLKSRPRLWMTFRLWLEKEMIIIRSQNLCNEMRNFVKDDLDDAYASGDKNEHDDELFGCMIGLYCPNENMMHEGLGLVMPRNMLNLETARFWIKCNSCGHGWPEMAIDEQKLNPMQCPPEVDPTGQIRNTDGIRCPVCKGRIVEISRNAPVDQVVPTDADRWLNQLHGSGGAATVMTPGTDANDWDLPSYDCL